MKIKKQISKCRLQGWEVPAGPNLTLPGPNVAPAEQWRIGGGRVGERQARGEAEKGEQERVTRLPAGTQDEPPSVGWDHQRYTAVHDKQHITAVAPQVCSFKQTEALV